jgi:hypothetical protein
MRCGDFLYVLLQDAEVNMESFESVIPTTETSNQNPPPMPAAY